MRNKHKTKLTAPNGCWKSTLCTLETRQW